MKIVMFGTGDFAVPSFRAVCAAQHQVLALYTQPDKLRAGKEIHANAMKSAALELGIPVFQPENINTAESLQALAELGADLFLVAAYGQILSRAFLSLPPLGSFNIHASLLPKYRGAAPINYALWQGETETGVTLIEVVLKLDAGPMVGVVRTPILPQETAGELEVRLSELAAPLTCEFLHQVAAGQITKVEQDPQRVTLAPKMTKEMGLINWTQSAAEIDCQIRGLQPWPTAFTFLHQGEKPPKRVVLRAVDVLGDGPSETPGRISVVEKETFRIQTGAGELIVRQIQPDGKKTQSAGEFLRGQRLQVGDRFGS